MSLFYQCDHTPNGISCPKGPRCGETCRDYDQRVTHSVEVDDAFKRGIPLDEDRHGNDISPRSLYHRLLAKSGKTHEQVQANLQAEHEERARLAAHEAIRPKPELDARIADHLFVEALVELCQKHNRSISLGEESYLHELDRFDLDDLRKLDPLTRPVPFPESKVPYR